VAIGGINASNCDGTVLAGASGVAVVSAIFNQRDVAVATSQSETLSKHPPPLNLSFCPPSPPLLSHGAQPPLPSTFPSIPPCSLVCVCVDGWVGVSLTLRLSLCEFAVKAAVESAQSAFKQ
jgi:hypothetical protein